MQFHAIESSIFTSMGNFLKRPNFFKIFGACIAKMCHFSPFLQFFGAFSAKNLSLIAKSGPLLSGASQFEPCYLVCYQKAKVLVEYILPNRNRGLLAIVLLLYRGYCG